MPIRRLSEGTVNRIAIKMFATIPVCVLVAGCPPMDEWRDTTGQHRNFDQQMADEKACYAGIARITSDTPSDEWKAAAAKILSCMSERGWTPHDDGNKDAR